MWVPPRARCARRQPVIRPLSAARRHSHYSSYEPELFPGLIYRMVRLAPVPAPAPALSPGPGPIPWPYAPPTPLRAAQDSAADLRLGQGARPVGTGPVPPGPARLAPAAWPRLLGPAAGPASARLGPPAESAGRASVARDRPAATQSTPNRHPAGRWC
eukprot:scaffold27695_cov64-Phaeocystis_antarctica.AAC.2